MDQDLSILGLNLSEAHRHAKDFQSITSAHIGRLGNLVAHHLPTWGQVCIGIFYFGFDYPSFLQEFALSI